MAGAGIMRLGSWMWRAALASGVSLCVIVALLPHPPQVPGNPSDTLLHAGAFVSLALLSRVAFPKSSAALIVLLLAALGLAIECAQAMPGVGRDASFEDWAVDIAASAIGVCVFDALLVRAFLGRARS